MNKLYQFVAKMPAIPTLISGWSFLMAPHALFATVKTESATIIETATRDPLMTVSITSGIILTWVVITVKIIDLVQKLRSKGRSDE